MRNKRGLGEQGKEILKRKKWENKWRMAGRKKKRGNREKKKTGRVEKSEKILRYNIMIKDKKKIEERKGGRWGRGGKKRKMEW